MDITRFAIWTSLPYQKDEIFNPNSILNRDNCLQGFRMLKDALSAQGIQTHTFDYYVENDIQPDIVLYLDIPNAPLSRILGKWLGKNTSNWLILQECEVVKPKNWNQKIHDQYDKIFTWKTDLIDGDKYIQLYFSNELPLEIPKMNASEKEKFCTIIAGNKKSNHSLELYSERVRAIRWFEKHHPEDFDLYGIGWNEFRFHGPKFIRALNRIKVLTKLLAPKFPSYKGKVESKKKTLEKYRFSICYENARDIPGYITEKIFDCFISGCIPIYWGANNITDFIPSNCYIDARNFSSYEEMHAYLKSISDEEYLTMLNRIEKYLIEPASYLFTHQFYVEQIMKEVNHDKSLQVDNCDSYV